MAFFGFKGFCSGVYHLFFDCVLGFSMAGWLTRLFVEESRRGLALPWGLFLKKRAVKNQWFFGFRFSSFDCVFFVSA